MPSTTTESQPQTLDEKRAEVHKLYREVVEVLLPRIEALEAMRVRPWPWKLRSWYATQHEAHELSQQALSKSELAQQLAAEIFNERTQVPIQELEES